MTGYGEASAQVDGIHYFLEVRSLNNKYFKATIRLAEEFQGLEAEMETLLRTKVTRGTVTLNARCSDASGSAAYQINVAALKRYAEQLRSLSEPNLGTAPLDVGALLALPGVLQPPANEEERFEQARSAFIPLLERALDGLIVMRDREGVSLADDLRAQRIYIAERLTEINRLAPNVVAEYQQRLRQRIEILLKEFDRQVEPSDLVREIAVYAERTDIAEEIKRLGAHLEQFGEMLEKCEQRPIGRTLDFLAQEMLREANTIASKSPDAEISRRTVEIKGAIDRIKEQCQNVE
jgi:uncharacterized protein (TIGR00255 family)